VLEAAQFGLPIIVGPYTENFRDIIGVFQRAQALCVVTIETLAPTLMELLGNDACREQMGRRALQVMQAQQGATERTVEALISLLPGSSAGEPRVTAENRA